MRLIVLAAALAMAGTQPAAAQTSAAQRDAYAAEMDLLVRAELCAGEPEPMRLIATLMNQTRVRYFGPGWDRSARVAGLDEIIRGMAATAVRDDTAHACFTAGRQLERHLGAHAPR